MGVRHIYFICALMFEKELLALQGETLGIFRNQANGIVRKIIYKEAQYVKPK